MNTPAHLILGATAFGKPGNRAVSWAALVGAIMPDLSLYLLAGASIFIFGYSPQQVFGEFYFSDAWQTVFAIDNSFVLWGAFLALVLWKRSPIGIAFAGAALLHLAFDFPLHHDDARRHFWPVSNWVFESPVSYWDGRHFGNIVGPIEAALVVLCSTVLWRRFRDLWSRVGIAALVAMQLAPFLMWQIMFSGG